MKHSFFLSFSFTVRVPVVVVGIKKTRPEATQMNFPEFLGLGHQFIIRKKKNTFVARVLQKSDFHGLKISPTAIQNPDAEFSVSPLPAGGTGKKGSIGVSQLFFCLCFFIGFIPSSFKDFLFSKLPNYFHHDIVVVVF